MDKPSVLSDERQRKIARKCWRTNSTYPEAIMTAQRDDTWQKAQDYYEPIIRGLKVDIETLSHAIEVLSPEENDAEQGAIEVLDELQVIQQAKAEVVESFHKAIKDLRGEKDIDLTEREFEVFYSIRNDGLAEGYDTGRAEVAGERK